MRAHQHYCNITSMFTHCLHLLKNNFEMSSVVRLSCHQLLNNIRKSPYTVLAQQFSEDTEFRVLNLRSPKRQIGPRKKFKKPDVLPPRSRQMAVDQDWGNVWPGPRSFHPATVPLPLRQGYAEKGVSPGKYANAELMKIPNFLHLTPPVIKRQCEALKQFCTSWPSALKTDAKCEEHFPMQVSSSNYCYSSPSIRDPLARIVTVKVKLSRLPLDTHAKDKFLRLIGDRYDEETDVITIVTDRCPMRNQNYDYAMYLLTAIYHESWRIEPWEQTKSEADMEYYDWNVSPSRKSLEALCTQSDSDLPNVDQYRSAVDSLMNEGESEYTVTKYGESVREILQLPLS